MSKYREKGSEIIACRIGDDQFWPDEIWEGVKRGAIVSHLHIHPLANIITGNVEVSTIEGTITGHVGDWIIRKQSGHFQVMPHGVFIAFYEKAT